MLSRGSAEGSERNDEGPDDVEDPSSSRVSPIKRPAGPDILQNIGDRYTASRKELATKMASGKPDDKPPPDQTKEKFDAVKYDLKQKVMEIKKLHAKKKEL